MPIRSLTPQEYYPTSPRSGLTNGGRVFRMSNLILIGDEPHVYAEALLPPLDLSENIAAVNLTGTLACTANSTTIVGTNTAFKSELHIGQMFTLYNGSPNVRFPLVVDQVIDDTHVLVCRAPTSTSSGATGARQPRIFEMNKKRGTQLTGNATETGLGTILSVGSGVLRRNGAALPGVSLTATRKPQIAILNSGTGNYTVFTLGMAIPTTLTAADLAGGTKNMQGGVYSIRACPARQATSGYNNPSPKAEVTLTPGHKIRGTFPAADTANGQDAWMIFVTLFTQSGGINGPWFRYEPNELISYVQVGSGAGQIAAAGGTYDIEYNDAEVAGNFLLTYNNDPPPDAEFISYIGGLPIWVSCQGPGSTSPGPFVVGSKPGNIEAAPLDLAVPTNDPDTIVGFHEAQGRLYIMCTNTLQIGQATQSIDPRIPPLTVRPFWHSGFKNPDALIFVDGFLIGFTNHGLARSLADGDEGSEEFNFAIAMDEFFRPLNPGHVKLALDTKNNAVCVFHCGDTINASGFWTTRVWMYSLRSSKWVGDITLTSTTGDMIVSGVASVNGELEFLCGGLQADTSFTVRTYRWNAATAGPAVPWFIAWQFSDEGFEDRPKHIGPGLRVTGKLSGSPTAGVHIVQPGDVVNVTLLETSNNGSASGIIGLSGNDANVAQENRIEVNVDNAMQYTVRIDGTWNGATDGLRDRIDEVVVEWSVRGARR